MANEPAKRVLIVLTSNARRGAEVEGERLARELTSVGARADAVALAPASTGVTLPVPALGSTPAAPTGFRALRRRARAYDVVIAYGSGTLPACAIALAGTRIPFVYRSIGDPAAWVRRRVHQSRTGMLMRRTRHVVALWDGAADAIRRLYRLPSDRVTVIPNARSPQEFCPPTATERATARHQLGVGEDEVVVTVVGSLTAEKRVVLAIQSVALLDRHRLIVAGDGPQRAELEPLARSLLGDRGCFLGSVEDVRPILHAADVLALPSSTEGMPGIVLEAGFMGLPVVACDVGGVGWLFERGVQGTICAPDVSAAEFAAHLQAVARHGVGPAATLRRECSWEAVVGRWSAIIQDCARDR
jgi:glycosyltransferase involved in cell wall biosynthesis